ncbi:MAG TPA: ceramidase domain-containing protein [Chitinophagales bacterium]|nr:ceramidase domain-containing protein [Chitinophagales bacterium]
MFKAVYIRSYIVAFVLTSVAACIVFYLNHHLHGDFWEGMQLGNPGLFREYCELNKMDFFIRQTVNTYSNLAYFFLGCIIFQLGQFDSQLDNHRNPIASFPFLSLFFGLCMIYLAVGSAFFHASLTWIGQRIDMNGTYGICLFMIGICIYRAITKNDQKKKFKALFVIGILLSMYGFFYLHLMVKSTILLPVLIGLIIGFTVYNYLKNKERYTINYAILSLLFMLAAFVLRTLDVQKIGCMPTSIYQGHALWHLFTGMSVFFLYMFYRKENAIEQ